MIKTIIVDDEKAAIEELEFLLKEFDEIEIVETFQDPKKALSAVLVNDIDVIFLDISMPEMDGFALAEVITKLKQPPLIVFATAFDEYAINAFEVNAVDYLLKPIMTDRLKSTMKRIKTKMENKETNRQEDVTNLITSRYKEKQSTKVPLWRDDKIYLVNPEDIISCSSASGETTIATKKGEFISSESLNHFETILTPYNFFRCHRSYLIHIDDIKEIVPWFNNTYAVKLNNIEEKIPVSRRKAKEFKELLNL